MHESAITTLRVAVVGSGPAGFYAAEQLLACDDPRVEVDMIDRLPTPFGLVRAGVAPDHPKIKSVTRVYEKTAARDGYRFFGGVEAGRDVSCGELSERYHAVVYAHGTPADRRLGVPGEDLAGSHPATEIVGWYNGHPDFRAPEPDLSHPRAVVVGNGNVAADLARMLALDPAVLRSTDAADHAIDALERSAVREVVVLGRRGPAQAAFTTPELRELGEIDGVDVLLDREVVEADLGRGDELPPSKRRNVETLAELARRRPSGGSRRISLRFHRSPVEIQGDGRVERLVVAVNEPVVDRDGRVRARDTGRRETIDCGLVLRSVGYRGTPLDGLPFDAERGTVPNQGGRVVDPASGEPLAGAYVVGWIKRGPTGVIGTNKKDAQETVAHLLADHSAGRLTRPAPEDEGLAELLAERRPDHVSFAGWRAIDSAEMERGRPQGRPRAKICSTAEMTAIARQAHPPARPADDPPPAR